ncbi:hypothetical protein [Roseibium sp. MMSF_3412]|nr:hypothetical protein [Roseibium sp. MMSF_3412]
MMFRVAVIMSALWTGMQDAVKAAFWLASHQEKRGVGASSHID